MRGTTTVAVGVAAAALLAGCGGSSSSAPKDNGESKKTGPVVAADAANALQASGAVHLKGTGMDDGKLSQLDLQVQGNDAAGTFSQGGLQIEVMAVGGQSYLKAPEAFWRSTGTAANGAVLLGNRWVLIPASEGSLTDDFSLQKVADQIRKPTEGTIQPQVTTTQDAGQTVVVVTNSNGSTVNVASTGLPYPTRRIEKGTDASDITFSGFGQRQAITAPADALDLSKLTSTG